MPPPDASTAGGQSLWLDSTVDLWWFDRTPSAADDDTPRWLRPIGSTSVTSELLDERIVPGRLIRGGEPARTHVRVYRAVDGGGPIVIIERLHSDDVNDLDELETIRAATTVDLDRTDPLWIQIRTWTTIWGTEVGEQPKLELDQIWIWKNGWEPNHRNKQPISASAIARLIGQPLPLYPGKLITDAMLTKKAITPAGQPVSILDDPQGIELLLSHLQAVSQLPDYSSDSALQYAAGVIATIAARRDEVLVSQREVYWAPELRTQMPAGTCRGAVTVPRTLLAYERNDVKALQLDPPPRIDGPYEKGPDGRLRQLVTIDPRLIPALRRLRRRYLEDIDLPVSARAALELVVDDLQLAYFVGDPIAAALEQPLLVREHGLDPRHWVVQAFLQAGYDRVDHERIPPALAYRARRLEPDNGFGGSAEKKQWWLRRDWRPEPDDAPNQPALALTYETAVKASTWSSRARPAADYTDYTLHLEWSPLRQPAPESSIPSPVRLVAPPSSPSVYRPVFLYTDDATVQQLPNDGKYGPAWGVSSTDQLTPATLLWLGYNDYAIRRKHPELYERLRWKLWGSGSDALDQPVDELQTMLAPASDCRRV